MKGCVQVEQVMVEKDNDDNVRTESLNVMFRGIPKLASNRQREAR